MPQNWKTYKLGEITKWKSGGTPSKSKSEYWNGEIPWISAKTLKGRYVFDSNLKITNAALSKGGKMAPIGSLLFLVRGSGLYNDIPVAMVTKEVAYNQDIKCVMSKNDDITNHFLLYWFKGNKQTFTNMLEATSIGAGKFDSDRLFQLDINIPPLPEQTAIASILSTIDAKIENNLAINKTLEEMAMALYKEWFVDFGPFQDGKFVESELGMIPEGFSIGQLQDIIDFSNGYAFKSKDLLKEESDDCFHVFKMGHINKGGGLRANGTKSWIPKKDCDKLTKYVLKVGDILMSMTDMKDKVTILGHTALMNENNKYIVNQRVGLIRAKNDCDIDYPYLFLTTNNYNFIERLRSQANSGVQVNLSTSAIKNAQTLIPPKKINKLFDEKVKTFYEQINHNSLENEKLKHHRDTLLPKLISGEVRLNEFANT